MFSDPTVYCSMHSRFFFHILRGFLKGCTLPILSLLNVSTSLSTWSEVCDVTDLLKYHGSGSGEVESEKSQNITGMLILGIAKRYRVKHNSSSLPPFGAWGRWFRQKSYRISFLCWKVETSIKCMSHLCDCIERSTKYVCCMISYIMLPPVCRLLTSKSHFI